MTIDRQVQRGKSNNQRNPNQNLCTQAVARSLGVENATRYLHTIHDLVAAARTRYTVRSRLSSGLRGRSVGAVRDRLCKIASELPAAVGFLVRVDGHALLLDCSGATLVDTDPRKADRRKITHAYIVYS